MEIMPEVMHLAFQVLASIFASVIIVDTAITGAEVSNEALSLQALLEKYLEVQFQHPRAWTFLIDTLVKILSDAKPKQASPPRSVAIALKSITFTMRFIIKSRREQLKQRKGPAIPTATATATATATVTPTPTATSTSATSTTASGFAGDGSGVTVDALFSQDEDFKSHLGLLFHYLIRLIDIHEPALLGIQTKLIRVRPRPLPLKSSTFTFTSTQITSNPLPFLV